MRIRNIGYYFWEAGIGIWRNIWVSLASISVVVMSLLILGSFVAINLNIHEITEQVRGQVEIVVAVSNEVAEDSEQIEALRTAILDLGTIEQLTYVTKEEALAQMAELLGPEVIKGLDGRNPLPATFRVKPFDPEIIPDLALVLVDLPGVTDVDYGQDVVDRLFSFTKAIEYFSYGIIAVLSVMGLFLIANTIRLTIFARRNQINIMKFVGATDWFIRWPFILEGIMLGALGSLLAYVILFYGYNFFYLQASTWLYHNFLNLSLVSPEVVGMHLLKILFALGIGIGALGSGISVRKFLKV